MEATVKVDLVKLMGFHQSHMEGWDDESLRFHAGLMSWSTMRVDDKLGFLMPVMLKFSTAISFRHVIGCAKFGSEKLGNDQKRA